MYIICSHFGPHIRPARCTSTGGCSGKWSEVSTTLRSVWSLERQYKLIFLSFYLYVHQIFRSQYTSQAGALHIDRWVIKIPAQGICNTTVKARGICNILVKFYGYSEGNTNQYSSVLVSLHHILVSLHHILQQNSMVNTHVRPVSCTSTGGCFE
jgi:hypothetical protein